MGVTNFKGIDNISESAYAEMLRDNIVSYVDWGFLELGAFFNINIPSSGAYGGNREKLRPIQDPRFSDGRVWESYHKHWVWESGLSFASKQPIDISGIFVNNVFLSKNNTVSGYYIDYTNGRIVFNSPIPTKSNVKLEFSHKWVSVVPTNALPSIKELQYRTYRIDDTNLPVSSGLWTSLADGKIQLPAIAIESPVTREYTGYQLGGSQYAYSDIIMHVIAEDEASALKLSNIISQQKEQTIYIYDSTEIAKQNKYSLDYKGSLASGAMTYPQLVAETGNGGFRYLNKVQNGKIAIVDSEEQGCRQINNNLWHSPVRWTTEAILLKI